MTTVETVPPTRSEPSASRLDRFGHKAMLASAGTGFAIGVIITLAASPLLNSITKTHRNGRPALPTPVVLSGSQIRSTVFKLADEALSFSYNGRHRLQRVALVADLDRRYPNGPRLYDARIQFALNPNPAGAKFQIEGAESDCFLLLKTLYSHNLPLQYVDFIGTFASHGRTVAGLRAGSGPFVESKFAPWKSLSRTETKSVWAYLSPHWISHRFTQFEQKGST